jgi:type IV pilus assembly protein PilE
MRSSMRGFTLVELMITIVVIAILASIAIPSYRNHVMRSQRTSATSALMRLQAAQEKHFLQYNQYATRVDTVPPAGLNLPTVTDDNLYALSIPGGAPGFTAQADAQGSQMNDTRCRRFTIDQNGVRRGFDSGGADQTAECWR